MLWLECQQEHVELETATQVAGLLAALRRVRDWRDPRGVRYELAPVLALWIAGNIAGHDVSTAVWEWACRLPVGVLRGFGITGRVPSERTFRRLAEEGPPGRLDTALSGWIAAATPTPGAAEQMVAVAFDGKTLKGARSFTEAGSMRQQAVVEAVRHDTGTTLGHEQVIGGDEIECVKSLVKHVFDTIAVDLAGRLLVTADCLHSHEPLARLIRAKGGHWLFSIKGNQPSVQAKLAALPWREFENLHLTR